MAGQWGNDDVVRALTPRVRRWPGESASKRAQLGLETLARFGTDLALMNVYSMSQKMKFASLKTRAKELVDDIAEARGLTVMELGDRLIPDFDLDSRGRMELDYGPRTFLVTLDEHLQPRIKDVQRDKVIKSLPKPGKEDDESLAKEARAWFRSQGHILLCAECDKEETARVAVWNRGGHGRPLALADVDRERLSGTHDP